jgi:RimJ/RimL family protein N-acetyltransferase
MRIRVLTADDAEEYREVRLAALRDHPTAFCTDFSEESAFTIEEFRSRVAPSATAVSFGAFDEAEGGERPVGIATLLRQQRLRQRFRAMIVAMYVAPSHRGRGIAKELIAACIDRARGWEGVEEVCLCITVGNEPARRSYLACGFQPDFVDPRHFKYEGQYYDLEWMRFPLD